MKLTEVNGTVSNRNSVNRNSNKHFRISHIKKTDLIVFCAFLIFAVYALVVIVSQRSDIDIKKQELEDIKSQIIIEEVKNDEINDILNSNKADNAAYIEKSARENLDFAYKDERIFINISGD